MVWGSCPGCHSGCHRASPKLVGSWLQVLSERLCLCFFLVSPGMQVLISYCPKEELVCRLLAWVGKTWFQTVNVALASCFAWGTFSYCHRIKFKLPLSRPTAQQPSRQVASFLLTALWFCYISSLIFFFSESGFIFLISSNLYLVVLKEPKNVNLQCQLVPAFNFQNIHFLSV